MFEFRILVCGGRHFADEDLVHAYLFAIVKRVTQKNRNRKIVIIHGDAKGADSFARSFCERSWSLNIKQKAMPADWAKHGDRAGPIRNEAMADLEPDVCLAFPGGTGTQHMVRTCRKRKIKVNTIGWEYYEPRT